MECGFVSVIRACWRLGFLELNGDEVSMGLHATMLYLTRELDGLSELQGNLPPFPRGMLADSWIDRTDANEVLYRTGSVEI
jgi:hypothetical protein